MNFREFIVKLQNLPEQKKKIVLWSIVAVLGIIMGFFWIRGAVNGLSKFGEEAQKFKMPQIDTSNLPSMPSLDILQTTTPSNK